MGVERIIGIDFGTSTSVIRVKRYNNGQPVEDRLSKQDVIFNGNSPMVPTLIQRTDKGTYYGYEALISKKGETLYQNFKMDLESSEPEQKQAARELTEEFFTYMAKEYKSQSEGGHFGASDDTERTIVSYPVKWSDDTKEFMIKAAEKAGFKNVEGMDEAQAAIHAVTVQSEDYLIRHGLLTDGVPCNILLVDMGAGTTDLVLCQHTPGEIPKNEILCTWPKAGDTLFGGREVDEILRKYTRSLLPEDKADIVLKKNSIKEFKVWKETVVSPALEQNETVEEFSNIDNIVEFLDIEMEPYDLDRGRFEKLAEEYLEEFPRLIAGCIDDSEIQKETIDLVILTGGHSKWYFVNEMLTDKGKIDLPKIRENSERLIPVTRPQETVALGMIYRPLSAEFQKEPEPKMGDTTPVSEENGQVQKEESFINDLAVDIQKVNKPDLKETTAIYREDAQESQTYILTIKRRVQYGGAALPCKVAIDGQVVGSLMIGQSISLTVEAGIHKIEFYHAFNPKFLGDIEVIKNTQVTIYYDFWGRPYLNN